ncbi:probable metallophosphoesterase MTH_1774 [Coccomyxa sp. Obi]|nr:probable metallophosphoesterase MTH_1774 [Coccomyxa sp. Obi]
MKIGLLSDTHGVFDEELCRLFSKNAVELLLHSGDVGNHGGHQDIIKLYKSIAPVEAVQGNVDEDTTEEELPTTKFLVIEGWRILVIHILPKIDLPEWKAVLSEYRPDIVLHGHSHKYSVVESGDICYCNPGSAGPARFQLPRTAAILHLQPKETGEGPVVERIELKRKAPPRIPQARGTVQARRSRAHERKSPLAKPPCPARNARDSRQLAVRHGSV